MQICINYANHGGRTKVYRATDPSMGPSVGDLLGSVTGDYGIGFSAFEANGAAIEAWGFHANVDEAIDAVVLVAEAREALAALPMTVVEVNLHEMLAAGIAA